jgi:hypothetical protein
MVAVVRNFDAALDRRLQDGFALLCGDLTSINRQRDGIHKLPIISIAKIAKIARNAKTKDPAFLVAVG